MQKYQLDEMKLGWFIGDFDPHVFRTKDFEVAIKHYSAGESEKSHFHMKAVEVTVIVSGSVRMNNETYKPGDIILINKNESTDFLALTDTITCVVKSPSVIGDKHEVSE